MKKWEYKLISLIDMVDTYAPFTIKKYDKDATHYPYEGRVLTALNKLGQLGWEYIEHNPRGTHLHGVLGTDIYIFKRERK